MTKRFETGASLVFPRYKGSYLCDIVYGVEAMPQELAETIRTLRLVHKLQYPEIGFYLCETDQDRGASHGMGKALTELASLKLGDSNPEWI